MWLTSFQSTHTAKGITCPMSCFCQLYVVLLNVISALRQLQAQKRHFWFYFCCEYKFFSLKYWMVRRLGLCILRDESFSHWKFSWTQSTRRDVKCSPGLRCLSVYQERSLQNQSSWEHDQRETFLERDSLDSSLDFVISFPSDWFMTNWLVSLENFFFSIKIHYCTFFFTLEAK